jgi:coiled-coil domain-containing protein 55
VAKVREIESDRRYERKLLKERAEEDEQFGHKQKFVTSAYRKKLEEEKQWEYEDRLADKVCVCVCV